jgi:hypothetical protein
MRNGGMTDHAIPGRLAWPWSPIHIVAIDVTHHQPSRASPPLRGCRLDRASGVGDGRARSHLVAIRLAVELTMVVPH